MKDAATSFALQAEQPVQGGFVGSGDIRAFCPDLLGFYIAVDGAVGSRGDSEAPIELQTVKNHGDGPPYLRIGRIRRERCRMSPITVKRKLWWSVVISSRSAWPNYSTVNLAYRPGRSSRPDQSSKLFRTYVLFEPT